MEVGKNLCFFPKSLGPSKVYEKKYMKNSTVCSFENNTVLEKCYIIVYFLTIAHLQKSQGHEKLCCPNPDTNQQSTVKFIKKPSAMWTIILKINGFGSGL